MKRYEALVEAGGLMLWLPEGKGEGEGRKDDTPFAAAVRARMEALLAFADGEGPEPEAGWSVEQALTLRADGDPAEPREPPAALEKLGFGI